MSPECTREGYSQCQYLLETRNECVRLTITHEMPMAESQLIKRVGVGWPVILANLNSLLETGKVFEDMRALMA